MGADMDNKHLSNIIKHNAIVTRRKRNESKAHKYMNTSVFILFVINVINMSF